MCASNYYADTASVACLACPRHSVSPPGSKSVYYCSCVEGYFNDIVDKASVTQGYPDDVHCVALPPRFHFKADSKCDMKDMRYGTEESVGPDSMINPEILGHMIRQLQADVTLLKRADFNNLCAQQPRFCTLACVPCTRHSTVACVLLLARTELDGLLARV